MNRTFSSPTVVAGHAVDSVGDLVDLGRTSAAALRRLDKSGGRTAATARARGRHDEVLNAVLDQLERIGRHDLSGALVDEDKLATRLDVARDLHMPRPELQRRIKAARVILRSAKPTVHSRAWCRTAGDVLVFKGDDGSTTRPITCLSCLQA